MNSWFIFQSEHINSLIIASLLLLMSSLPDKIDDIDALAYLARVIYNTRNSLYYKIIRNFCGSN